MIILLVITTFVVILGIVIYAYISSLNLKKLSIVTEFTSDLFSSLEIDKVLPLVVDKIMIMLNPKRCSIMMLDDNNNLRIKVGKNISKYAIRGLKLKLGEGIAGQALKEGKMTFVRDVSMSPQYYKMFEVGYKNVKKESLVVIPLKYQDINYGVINLHYPVRNSFPSSYTEKVILKLVMEQVSVSIHNCLTYQKVVNDAMTKLFNHNYFIKRLEEEIFLARKYSTKLSLIMFDIDHFKKVNDTYGHQVGDLVLIEVANILQDNIRLTDIAGRYGGEEFGVILPNTNLKMAKVIAERLRENIAGRKIISLDKVINVTSSFGVAEFKVEETTEQLLYRADKMLYTAKNMGRNRVYGE